MRSPSSSPIYLALFALYWINLDRRIRAACWYHRGNCDSGGAFYGSALPSFVCEWIRAREDLARIDIDKQLEACGWTIQARRDLNLLAARGVAVREFPLGTGEADYLLFVDRKALGVIEALVAEAILTQEDGSKTLRIKCVLGKDDKAHYVLSPNVLEDLSDKPI